MSDRWKYIYIGNVGVCWRFKSSLVRIHFLCVVYDSGLCPKYCLTMMKIQDLYLLKIKLWKKYIILIWKSNVPFLPTIFGFKSNDFEKSIISTQAYHHLDAGCLKLERPIFRRENGWQLIIQKLEQWAILIFMHWISTIIASEK